MALRQRLHRQDRITQLRRFLISLALRGVLHPAAQVARQFLRAALEEQSGVVDGLLILRLRADAVDARRDAALDVVLEARPRALAGDHLVARSDAEQAMRERHRAPRQPRRQERPGVDVLVALDAPRDQHPREPLSRRQLQVGIVLVVAKPDVVLRVPRLDDVVLERQRLDDRVGDDVLEAVDLLEQRVGLDVQPPRAEIAAHPIAQRAGLADVDRLTRMVEIQVHARLLGQPGDLGLEIVNRHRVPCGV